MSIKSLPSVVMGLVLAVLLIAPASRLLAYPEPSALSRSWQFEVTCQTPQAIAVTDLQGRKQWYWYLPYKVINRTGEDRLFAPEFTIATEQGDIVQAGRGVPASVFNEIKKKLGNDLLESPAAVVGQFLQGPDFAKEGVAIWPAFGHDIQSLTVFFSGLSGETQVVKNPGNGEDVLVSKTLMLKYSLPGDARNAGKQILVLTGEKWVMR